MLLAAHPQSTHVLHGSSMLPFHQAIHQDASDSNSLHVIAKGLGMHQAFASLILDSVTSDSIILGINVSRSVATSLIYPTLTSQTNPRKTQLVLPRILSADYTVRDRTAVYSTSGFIIVTSAVLVHDLLHNAIPVERVKGLLIFAADRIKERSNHHFALNLFRNKNRNAFIKAFSENPLALSAGFHSTEKLMGLLYISRLSLWPRFHVQVRKQLKAHVPDLVDLCVPPTIRTGALLSALRDVVKAVLNDLKLSTRVLDYSELYREATADPALNEPKKMVLVPNFDDVARRQIEGASVRSAKVRSLLFDLQVLRRLLQDVLQLNPVIFYQQLATIRAAVTNGTNWLVRKEAQRAVLHARSRVWQVRKSDAEAQARTSSSLEIPRKWTALCDVLREIQSDVKTVGAQADVGRVLVLLREQRALDELFAMLQSGGRNVLKNQFEAIFPVVAARVQEGDSAHQTTITQLALPESQRRPIEKSNERAPKRRKVAKRPRSSAHVDDGRQELLDVFREVKPDNDNDIQVMLWAVEWVDLQGRGHRILDEYRPSFIVLYDADLALVRQVEVYKVSQPGRPVRMYILAYEDAVEEGRFRQSSAREKSAFKGLIRERATMTVHVNQEGKRAEDEFTQSVLQQADSGLSSRGKLGARLDSRISNKMMEASIKKTGGKVLVDTRELRSSLPMLLYQSCLSIVPITLEVGDFILSTTIGIERKSVPDLYGSFQSGRLFNQGEALCRHYKYPCLLIELDPNRSVSLTATSGGVPVEMSVTSIVSKMVLLIQQFSALRLLWVRGSHDAAELFVSLKANEDEPDSEKAASLGVDAKESEEEDYNSGPRALLRSLPGIDSQNIVRVMRTVPDVASLLSMSQKEMATLLGSAAKGKALYEFVNERPSEAIAALQ